MCGLVGILGSQAIPDLASIVARMNQAQHHRGPDQTGLFVDPAGKAALGHKRLSILDLTHGRQPMTDHEGLYTLVFNGEIYNHQELKAELVAKGHPIRTRSDTETLLYAFKEWGEGCLPRLRGMFAFAVYSHRDGSMLLARDRLGIKPMYYGFHDRTVLFSSECKAILEFPGFSRDLDPQAVSDYFSLMYVPAPKSIFKHIRKLPAGHWLRILPTGETRSQAYWDLDFTVDPAYLGEKGFERAQDDLLAALDEAVRCHMDSDVPLGAFLSGGVDSAAVAALMARNSARPILTNTIGLSDKAFDESLQAAQTAAFLKTDHREFRVEPNALEVMDKLAWYYDEPFADSSMIPTYYVCGMARQRVTVALSGDGGDENFAGYRRYFYDRLENRLRGAMPSAIRAPLFGALGALYPKADWLPQVFRAKTLLQNLSYSPVEGYFNSLTHFRPAMKRQLLSKDFQRSLGGYDSLSVFEEHWARCNSKDPLSRVQYLDFKTYLVDDILTKVDRASMAHSLEVRVPVLDHKVVELAARMPSDFKLHGKASKHVFKRSLEKILPEEIFRRKKTGFSIPIHTWFRGELKEFAESRLLGSGSRSLEGMIEPEYVRTLWKEHQAGMRNHGFPLFALLSFSLWHSKFSSPNPPKDGLVR
jgi:asparagine synthase (glutamine-hydrolysing)